MNIFVGNLSFSVQENELRSLFYEKGEVSSVSIIVDRISGRPKGFGFVEMNSEEEANSAIAALNGKDVDGRALKVNEAKPKTEGRGGGGRGHYGGGGRRDRW